MRPARGPKKGFERFLAASAMAEGIFLGLSATGFQILLNYLMKFTTELTPNSCRDYLGREGGEDWVRPALRMEIYRDSSLLLLLGLCKAGRALFLRSKLEGATCFAQSGSRFF